MKSPAELSFTDVLILMELYNLEQALQLVKGNQKALGIEITPLLAEVQNKMKEIAIPLKDVFTAIETAKEIKRQIE